MQAESNPNNINLMRKKAIGALLEFWQVNKSDTPSDFFMGDDYNLYVKNFPMIDGLEVPELNGGSLRIVPTAKLSIDNETIIPSFRIEYSEHGDLFSSPEFDTNGLVKVKDQEHIDEMFSVLSKDDRIVNNMDIKDSIIEATYVLDQGNVNTFSV